MIAHRLWTIRTADRMLVIEKGRIIETGRHKGSDSGEGALHAFYMHQLQQEFESGTKG